VTWLQDTGCSIPSFLLANDMFNATVTWDLRLAPTWRTTLLTLNDKWEMAGLPISQLGLLLCREVLQCRREPADDVKPKPGFATGDQVTRRGVAAGWR
jgi:hypothetical protein